MALDEFSTVLKAQTFVHEVDPTTIPVSLDPYLQKAHAELRQDADLAPDEPGFSFPGSGKFFICVNANDREERQRFTVCHELGHIVLGLPSNHKAAPWWSAKRPLAEILCDVFAAELLLPRRLFEPLANEGPVSMAAVDSLAVRFLASTTATGSRYAAATSAPCAFVLSEAGQVRYASRSKALRDASAGIPPRVDVPSGSVSARMRAGESPSREEIDADLWFSNWERGGVLLEEARYLASWDQILTLLWFDSEEVPSLKRPTSRWDRDGDESREPRDDEDELGLKELDGNLRWPIKKRRR
jgi:hypothetical protein